MKTNKYKFIAGLLIGGLAFSSSLIAQEYELKKEMQYFRTYDQDGVNVFETPVQDDTPFNGLYVRIGGHFAQQFQALDSFSR